MNISFSDQEKNLFQVLLNVVKDKTPSTVLRIAGGYVRDRLLGKESSDIDIAISNMSGEDFANLVLNYVRENKIDHKNNLTVVKSNPKQSKHLATAMLTILDFSIDFVNLRKENYADSRIPTIEIGTPEEDALRRDLTINALFYNLNTNEVEDFVGGITDLENKIARTPMDPIQTWIDDPLRILRTIRFAAKYDLKIADELYLAAKNLDVREALFKKISKERIWREMAGYITESKEWKSGFLCSNNTNTLLILHSMNLFPILFSQCTVYILLAFADLEKFTEIHEPIELLIINLSCLLLQSNIEDIEDVLVNLTAPNDITKRVIKIVKNSQEILSIRKTELNISDKELRRFMRNTGNDWRKAIRLCFESWQEMTSKLESFEKEMGGTEPLLPIKGKDLLNLGWSQGPELGKILNELKEELLEHPTMTYNEAIDFVNQLKSNQFSETQLV
jgi:tRNA nucleotidyltransferase/poly(A) polymerase